MRYRARWMRPRRPHGFRLRGWWKMCLDPSSLCFGLYSGRWSSLTWRMDGLASLAMFIGHFAPAFLIAARPQSAGLGSLFVAAQLTDIAFATLVLTGQEKMRVVPGFTALNDFDLYHMPYSHSLMGTILFGALFGLLVMAGTGRKKAGIGAALVVISHWFLDWLTHKPDLTLFGAPPKWGLGLWDMPYIAIPLELGLLAAAIAYFMHQRGALLYRGRVMILAAVLLLAQLIDWMGDKPDDRGAGAPLLILASYGILILLAHWASATPKKFEQNRA